MVRGRGAVVGLLLISGARPAAGQVRVEVLAGSAYNVPTPLRIEQEGEPTLRLRARYDTRGFRRPLYWTVRIGAGGEGARWEVELVHHKLHLRNAPPEVTRFTMTHGFNFVLVNRSVPRGRWRLRAGAGVVVPHPESTVRGRPLSEREGILGRGYYLAGPAVQGAAARRLGARGRVSAFAEGKVTAVYADVPVAGGRARVPNVALHLTVGVGVRLGPDGSRRGRGAERGNGKGRSP